MFSSGMNLLPPLSSRIFFSSRPDLTDFSHEMLTWAEIIELAAISKVRGGRCCGGWHSSFIVMEDPLNNKKLFGSGAQGFDKRSQPG